MSNNESYDRFWTNPVPPDLSWEELVKFLSSNGFEIHRSKGSHYTFKNAEGFTLHGIVKPHGKDKGNGVKRFYIRKIRAKFKEWNI